MLVVLDRPGEWQIGYLFPKGAYQQLRAAGIEALASRSPGSRHGSTVHWMRSTGT